jgi:hypothetical protein
MGGGSCNRHAGGEKFMLSSSSENARGRKIPLGQSKRKWEENIKEIFMQ